MGLSCQPDYSPISFSCWRVIRHHNYLTLAFKLTVAWHLLFSLFCEVIYWISFASSSYAVYSLYYERFILRLFSFLGLTVLLLE